LKILFDTDEMAERCSGCKEYTPHNVGKTDDGQPCWKCRTCGRLTIWLGGDSEKVVSIGNPPAGV